jgi:hypothetical protein
MLSALMLSALMLSVIMLNVVVLKAAEPSRDYRGTDLITTVKSFIFQPLDAKNL